MTNRNALLLVFDGFCEFEIASAISMLRGTHQLMTIALENHPCKSEAGLTVIPDLTIRDAQPENFEVLIIPGGDLRLIASSVELSKWVKDFADLGKVVGAICSGVYVPAKAGVLKDVPYTVTLTKAQREFLGCFNETNFQYKPVVIYKNIITAQGHAYVDFAIELNKLVREVSEESIEFYQGKRNVYLENNF